MSLELKVSVGCDRKQGRSLNLQAGPESEPQFNLSDRHGSHTYLASVSSLDLQTAKASEVTYCSQQPKPALWDGQRYLSCMHIMLLCKILMSYYVGK